MNLPRQKLLDVLFLNWIDLRDQYKLSDCKLFNKKRPMHYWKDSNTSIMQIQFIWKSPDNFLLKKSWQKTFLLHWHNKQNPPSTIKHEYCNAAIKWVWHCHCLSNAITPVRSNNVSEEDNLPIVQYLLGLDRRGTYVVRESVEKVLCIRMIELLPFTSRLLFTTTRVTSQRQPSKFPSRKLRMKCLSTCWDTTDQTSSISTDARVSVWTVMRGSYAVSPWQSGKRKSRWLCEPSDQGLTPEKESRIWSSTTTQPADVSVGRGWVSIFNRK